MKKTISLSLVLSLVFAILCAIPVSASNEKDTAEYDTACHSALAEGASIIHFDATNKIHFARGEAIDLLYIIESEYVIDRVEYNSESVNVTSLAKVPNDEERIRLVAAIPSEYGSYTVDFDVVLKEDLTSESEEVISSTLYIVNTEYGAFVNYYSEARATDAYLAYLVENGYITEADFKEIRRNRAKESITQTVTVEPFENSNPNARASGNTSITFVWQWSDYNDNIHPLRDMKLEIYEDDPKSVDLLATMYTDVNGRATYTFNNVTAGEDGGYDLFCEAYAENDYAQVISEYGVYDYYSDTYNNIATGSSVTVTTTITMYSDVHAGFSILQALDVANEYAVYGTNGPIDPVTLFYPYTPDSNDESSTFYRTSEETIYLCDYANSDGNNRYNLASYESWDVIMHEYAHHVQHYWGITDSPGGRHSLEWNIAVDRVEYDKSKGVEGFDKYDACTLAWGEGWAYAFALVAQHRFEANHPGALTSIRYGVRNTTAYIADANIDSSGRDEPVNVETVDVAKGEACELNIIALLWDLYDDPTTDDDGFSFTERQWWNYTTGSPYSVVRTMNEFADYFYSQNFSWQYKSYFGELLTENGMAPRIRVNYCDEGTETTPARIVWNKGGDGVILDDNDVVLQDFTNDTFEIVVLNGSHQLVFRKQISGNVTSYRFTAAEWSSILNISGDVYYVSVMGSDNDTGVYDTGAYGSELVEFTKP